MAVKVYWVHTFHNGARLGIMARPRGNDWLEDEIISLKPLNVGLLVSLLEAGEIEELGLQLQELFCLQQNIGYLNFPIVDRSVPSDAAKIEKLIVAIENAIQNGISVVIHCRMGIGRSSIIAGCILKRAGIRVEQIVEITSKARGLKVPDTNEQLEWLMSRLDHRGNK